MAVITRAAWGAGPHRAGTIRLPVSRYFLHHTVTAFWVGAQAARNLQRIARSRGFADISYSWLTDRQGNEIEGRGWGRQGAHTLGYNSTSHALSLVGNLEAHPMPAGMVRGAVRLIRRHRAVGPGRITHPHSAVSSTACPGGNARSRIPEMNQMAAGTPPPPPPPPPPKKGFLMSLNDAQQLAVWRGVRALNEKVDTLPTLDEFALKLIQTLSPDHDGHPTRAGDLDPHVQKQLSMVIEATVKRVLIEHGVIESE